MPQSPNNYNPFNHPDKADKRKNIVLSLMNQHGYITEAEMKEAQATLLSNLLVKEEERGQQSDIPYDLLSVKSSKKLKINIQKLMYIQMD